MRIVLVHNQQAGGKPHDRDHLIQLLTEGGHTVEYFSPQDDWLGAAAAGTDVVAAAGGDGTVAAVARALAGRNVPITVFPAGTANNIATGLGLANVAVEQLIEQLPNASLRLFDCGIARTMHGSERFLESVGAGLLSTVMAVIERGHAGHVNRVQDPEQRIAAALDVFENQLQTLAPVDCSLTIDGHDRSGKYLVVEVLNFGAAGPNLWLSPSADGADGLLDVVLVEEASRRLLAERLALYRSSPSRAPSLPVHKARRVTLRGTGGDVHCDDTLWDSERSRLTIELSIERGAIPFLVSAG
ncbi:MAG TPA: diacylglycerol kinase family protein [Vicinamibacterales bacterium]|nr:diacylglycerol kinase family protein [Vicinamibacterales bacterium]